MLTNRAGKGSGPPDPDTRTDTDTHSAVAGESPGDGGDDTSRSVLANTGSLMASRIAQAVLGWAGTLLIARSLDLHEFGRFTVIFTVLGLMAVVTDMGIGRIAVRGMLGEDDSGASHDPGRFAGTYIMLRFALGLVGYVVACAVVILLGYPGEVVQAMFVAGIVVVLATPSSALDVVFQSQLKMHAVSTAGVLGLTAQLALTAAIAAAGGNLLLFTLPAVLCQVVVLLWKVPAALRLVPVRLTIDLPVWRRLLREALPLTAGFGLATLYYRIDGVMLSRLDTFDAVGIYGVSYKFIDIVHFAATAVTVPLLTVLVRTWPGDMPEFRAAVRRAAMLLALLGGVAMVGLLGFAKELTTVLYGADYAAGEHATRVLIVAQVLTLFSLLALTCLVAVERHKVYPLVMLCGLVLNVAANFWLIPHYSYEGAASATLGSEVVTLVALCLLLRRVPDIGPLHLRPLVMLPIGVAVAVAVGLGLNALIVWPLAATVAVACFLGLALVGGLVGAAGLPIPASVRRLLPERSAS